MCLLLCENSFHEYSAQRTDPLLKPIQRVAAPIREQVAQMIRDSIVSGSLQPGQRLIEREICEATGASRASVREALRQLESERLVTSVPQHGTVVAVIDEHHAKSLYDTREALETLIVRNCVGRASDGHLRALQTAVSELEQAAQRADADAVAAANAALYECLFAGAENPVAEELLRALHVRVMTLPLTITQPGRATQIAQEMAATAHAVISRDAEAAATLISAHVRNSGDHVLNQMRTEPGGDSPN